MLGNQNISAFQEESHGVKYQRRFEELLNDVGMYLFIYTSSLICFQCTLSLPSEKIRKPYAFLMFSWGGERLRWKRIG